MGDGGSALTAGEASRLGRLEQAGMETTTMRATDVLLNDRTDTSLPSSLTTTTATTTATNTSNTTNTTVASSLASPQSYQYSRSRSRSHSHSCSHSHSHCHSQSSNIYPYTPASQSQSQAQPQRPQPHTLVHSRRRSLSVAAAHPPTSPLSNLLQLPWDPHRLQSKAYTAAVASPASAASGLASAKQFSWPPPPRPPPLSNDRAPSAANVPGIVVPPQRSRPGSPSRNVAAFPALQCYSAATARTSARGPDTMSAPTGSKRSSDGLDSDSSGSHQHNVPGGPGKMKLPRLDRGPEDFSSVVKTRLQSYTRTGQACDRCKVRKIRCDALPEGCSHCINLNLDCYVTDRVTGRTERRGYLQQLEREKKGMMAHIHELEKRMKQHGVEVPTWRGPSRGQPSDGAPCDVPNGDATEPANASAQEYSSQVTVKSDESTGTSSFFKPNFPRSRLESRPAETVLGVGGDSDPMSSIAGTRLSVFGATIDTASFSAPDVDEPSPDTKAIGPLYNKSVQGFLQSVMGVNPRIEAPLPARDDAFTYANLYFVSVGTFLPLLHKPTFMHLLSRIYDDPDCQPSTPELVKVHMVFAIIFFQFGIRNWEQADQRRHLNDLSNRHYHFALGKFFEVLSSDDFAAVQALALMASHTRAFPKPGCGSMVSNLALQRAIEFNLHRAVKKSGEPTDLQYELRKRAWWVIATVCISLSGRRGRPMPITVEDVDVPFPEPIADELLSDQGVDTTQSLPCPYHIGIAGFKLLPVFMEIHQNLYCVRRDRQNYAIVVEALEQQVRVWEDELAPQLRLDATDHPEYNHVAALYADTFKQEFRLCLRHPSVAMTSDKKMMAENTRICEEAGREMLRDVQQILEYKCLDTTWYQISVWTLSIFSMLVGHWERRFDTTPAKVAELRGEMDQWLNILNETSMLLESGPGMSQEIGAIIERTVEWIERDMRGGNTQKRIPQPPAPSSTSAAPSSASVPPPQQHVVGDTAESVVKAEPQPQPARYDTPHLPSTHSHMAPVPNGPARHALAAPKDYYDNPQVNGHPSYQPMAYSNHSQPNIAQSSYQTDPSMYYASSAQPSAAAAAASMVNGSTMPDSSAQQSNPLAAFATQATRHVATPTDPTGMMWTVPSNPWSDWTAAIADTHDRYSANALLSLGNAGRVPVATGAVPDGMLGQPGNEYIGVPQPSQWPLCFVDTQGMAGTNGS